MCGSVTIDLDVVDDTIVTDTPPWSQSEPQICLFLTKYKNDTTNAEVYKQAFLEITSRHPKYMQIDTDGSKVDEKVAAAAVSSVAPNSPFTCRLRYHCSIYRGSAGNSVCSKTSIPVKRKEIHDFLRFALCSASA